MLKINKSLNISIFIIRNKNNKIIRFNINSNKKLAKS